MDPYSGDFPHPDPDSGLQESMWRLGLGGGGNRSGGWGSSFPDRPGERDCAYYLRTGTCGYGERCRYNHPFDRGTTFQQVVGAARLVAGEYPERYGQPFCEYYLKTGTCKFGSLCKYHHPRQGGGSVQPASLNYYGYPLRPGAEECSYFMKTGKCKFGLTCKFHHPQPTSASVSSPAPVFYPTVPPPSIATPQQYPEVGGWQVGRSSSALSGTYMPNSYGPMLFSPRVLPVPGWSSYVTPISEATSSGSQQSTRAGPLYGQPSQLSPSAPAYSGLYPLVTSFVGPSSSTQKEQSFPQRPGQPECQFYMRTGECKFGATCRYHHPPDWSIPATNCTLSPLGLPLRSGAQLCSYYAQHGVCKYGPTCKFDHPIGTLGYSPASFIDIPAAPYPSRISLPTVSTSPLELKPDFHPSNVSFSTKIPSSEDPSSGSGSPLFAKGRFLPHSIIQSTSQMSTANCSSTKGQTGEISSSS